MDIEFARTFLAVAAAGNFVRAAERLHVTQSTVSARIQTLENRLGVQLFRRGRGGAELTMAGQRFLRHAKTLVQTLEAARHDVGLPAGFRGSLSLAARIALWEGYLPRWAEWMQLEAPDISLRMETGMEAEMIQGLVQGSIDIAVMYTPENRPGLGIEHLFDETLQLYSSNPTRGWPDPGYIHIDWGEDFFSQFSARYPDIPPPALTANIGWLAMQCMFESGGAAFLPVRIARRWQQQERLFRISGSPLFKLPVYMVYPVDQAEDDLAAALLGLRMLAVEIQQES